MDKLLIEEVKCYKEEQESINEELNIGVNGFSILLQNGLGEQIKQNKPCVLTEREKKYLKTQKKHDFFKRIKSFFIGEKNEWYQDLMNL